MEVIKNKVAIIYSKKDEDVQDRSGYKIWGNSKVNGKLIRLEILYRSRNCHRSWSAQATSSSHLTSSSCLTSHKKPYTLNPSSVKQKRRHFTASYRARL